MRRQVDRGEGQEGEREGEGETGKIERMKEESGDRRELEGWGK